MLNKPQRCNNHAGNARRILDYGFKDLKIQQFKDSKIQQFKD
jgi:hypothetical protein